MVSGLQAGDTAVKVEFQTISLDALPQISMHAGTVNGDIYSTPPDDFSQFWFPVSVGEVFDEISAMNFISGYFQVSIYPRAGTGGGFFQSTNGGANFIQINEGLPSDPKTSSMATTIMNRNNTLLDVFVGLFENTNNGGRIFKRTFLIGIQQISTEIPNNYSLSQNFPNPFNPATNIKFQIPKSSSVKLIVYDIVGREVATLVSERLRAGAYQADWNASNYPSGVYFYKLITDEYSETKKMVLIK